ncbi:hypothetical protein ACLOJK_021378 [Asimina triloba]
MAHSILVLSLFALAGTLALAAGPSPLQDFCVAKRNTQAFVNGLVCEDPKLAQAEDFFFSGLNIPGNTSNSLGVSLTTVFVDQIPGLNTLGISMARRDFAPRGVAPPHLHPRATEILTVLEGTIFVGFVTSNPDNRFVSKILNKGDVFVFPMGLIHFQQNIGYGHATTISGLSSENPGVIIVPNSIFGSNGPIPAEVLSRTFQVDKALVEQLQSKF